VEAGVVGEAAGDLGGDPPAISSSSPAICPCTRAMTSHVLGSCYDEQNDNSGNVAESGNDTDDEVFEDIANGGAHGQHDTDVDIGSLDDEALFGILKKIVCIFLFFPQHFTHYILSAFI